MDRVREGVRDTRSLVMADSNSGSNRMLSLLVLIVGLVCLANLIVVSVMINKPSYPSIELSPTVNTMANPLSDMIKKIMEDTNKTLAGQKTKRSVGMQMEMNDEGERVYTVQYGHDFGAYEYKDSKGEHKGFFKDLIEAVCGSAGVVCRPVYDSYKNCWMSHPGEDATGGQGLLGGWYDGCIGWAPTSDRQNVFDFSDSFTKPLKSYMYRKAGSKLSTGKIGLVEGWAENEQCLTINVSPEEIVYYRDPQTLAKALTDEEVDSAFASEAAFTKYSADKSLVKVTDIAYTCAQDGLAIMTRKDSTFLSVWNVGFQRLRDSGMLNNMCNTASKNYGGKIDCPQH